MWQAAVDLHIPGQENSGGSVSCETKRQAVGHLRLVKRSREEICHLKYEMANCLTFYHDKIQQLEVIQQQLTSGCPLNVTLHEKTNHIALESNLRYRPK